MKDLKKKIKELHRLEIDQMTWGAFTLLSWLCLTWLISEAIGGDFGVNPCFVFGAINIYAAGLVAFCRWDKRVSWKWFTPALVLYLALAGGFFLMWHNAIAL
jgi:hypothetical protein